MTSQTAGKAPTRDRPNIMGELSLAAVLIGFGVFTVIGTVAMQPIGDDVPGPRFFPMLVAILLFVTGIGLVAKILLTYRKRHARAGASASTDEEPEVRSDLRTLFMVVAAFLVFAAVLQPIGWLISAAGLYYAISLALGSRAYLRDLVIAFIFAAVVQIAFSLGLGLSLPAGAIGAVF